MYATVHVYVHWTSQFLQGNQKQTAMFIWSGCISVIAGKTMFSMFSHISWDLPTSVTTSHALQQQQQLHIFHSNNRIMINNNYNYRNQHDNILHNSTATIVNQQGNDDQISCNAVICTGVYKVTPPQRYTKILHLYWMI